MTNTKKRIDALERTAAHSNAYSLTYLDNTERIHVVIHDGKEPPDEIYLTPAEYDDWKRTRPGDWVSIVVKYE